MFFKVFQRMLTSTAKNKTLLYFIVMITLFYLKKII